MWEREVAKRGGYTRPWLDLDLSQLQAFAEGNIPLLPEPFTCLFPASVFAAVWGKAVLCLASGGGQQSAAFGLLGAQVTVADLTAGQLEGDQKAAVYYGYSLNALQADMRDLSAIEVDTFDLVYQANSLAYVPDINPVFAEVARVLKPNGLYRVVFGNPATVAVQWDGKHYFIEAPFQKKQFRREDGGLEFRHTTADIFNSLLQQGFSISQVFEEPYSQDLEGGSPGSWNHERAFVAGGFGILAQRT